jgi:cytochrome c-type biogenesis protein CcmH/NrfF
MHTPSSRRLRAARLIPVVALLSLALAGAAELSAQRMIDRPNAAEAERAIAQLRSPYCPGLMLETCPSPPAAALRDSIYDLAAEGLGTSEIVDWMLARHGEEFRGVPQGSGAGLWAWVIPPLALLIGAGAVFGWLHANRTREEPVLATEESSLTDGDRQKLAAALKDWEDGEEEYG